MFNDYDFQARKKERTEHFRKYVYKWKLVLCTACSGSGYYDDTGSPKCGCCGGIGRMMISPEKYKEYKNMPR